MMGCPKNMVKVIQLPTYVLSGAPCILVGVLRSDNGRNAAGGVMILLHHDRARRKSELEKNPV